MAYKAVTDPQHWFLSHSHGQGLQTWLWRHKWVCLLSGPWVGYNALCLWQKELELSIGLFQDLLGVQIEESSTDPRTSSSTNGVWLRGWS